MHGQEAAVQNEKQILAFAIGHANAASLGMTRDMRRGLRLCSDGMKDVNAADSPTMDEGTEGANDGFHFGKFRHERRMASRSGLESKRMFSSLRFGSIAER